MRIPWQSGPRVVLLLALLAWPSIASGGALPPPGALAVDLQARVGWAGWIPLGAWLPVRVDLQVVAPVDGVLLVDVPVPGSDAPLSFRRPARLGPGAPQHMILDIFILDARRALTVRLLAAGQQVARREIPLSAGRAVEGVVLALTREAAGLEFLADSPRKIRPAYITEQDLPTQWQGYAGVQLLAIRDLNTAAVSPAQQQALEQWVAQGGRLVVTGGERLVRLRAPWLLKMLPAVPRGLTEVRHLDGSPGARGPISVALLTLRPSAIGRPWTARWRWGAGSVHVWAFDPFAPELRAGRAGLWAEALDAPVHPWVASADLAGALPTSRPLPGTLQGGLLVISVAYVAIVRQTLARAGRTRGSWLWVPLVALVFAMVLYGFALQARRVGTSAVQVSVVEVLPGTGMARVRTVVAVISLYGTPFQLRTPPDTWMQPLEPRPLVFDDPNALSGNAPPSGLRIEAMRVMPMSLEGRAVAESVGLRAEIDNRSGLAIADARIFRSGQVYRLPPVGAHLSAVLDPRRWEPFRRQPNSPATVDERVIEEVLTRLQHQPAPPDVVAWLVGRIEGGQLAITGRPMSVEAHSLIVVPLRAGATP